MYIFHFRTKISDVSGQTISALFNPREGGKALVISKVEISSSSLVDVALLAGEIDYLPTQNVSETIRNSNVGSKKRPVSKGISEPTFLNPVDLIKSASILQGTRYELINESDYLSVEPGVSVGVRVVPIRPYQDVHVTFVYEEVETSFKAKKRSEDKDVVEEEQVFNINLDELHANS